MDKPEEQIDWDSQILGESASIFRLTTHIDFRDAALALAKQATQSIHIFSHDLEAMTYDQAPFLEALTRVAHFHRTTTVQILLRDPSPAVKQGHRLIEVCQRFSSDIKIRCLTEDYENHRETFLIADRTGVLYRDDYDRNLGMVCFKEVHLAEKLLRLFDDAWERSRPASELRRLHL